MGQRYGVEDVKLILDLASEEVMSLPDEEIRARANAERIDLRAQGNRFRQLIEKQSKVAGLERMRRARHQMEEAARSPLTGSSSQTVPIEHVKARLLEIIQLGIMHPTSKLTLNFRNGKEMTEGDLRTLLEDCEALIVQARLNNDDE